MTEEVCLEVQIAVFFIRPRQEIFGFFGRARVSGFTCFSHNVNKPVTAYIYVAEEVCLEVPFVVFFTRPRRELFGFLGRARVSDSPACLLM